MPTDIIAAYEDPPTTPFCISGSRERDRCKRVVDSSLSEAVRWTRVGLFIDAKKLREKRDRIDDALSHS